MDSEVIPEHRILVHLFEYKKEHYFDSLFGRQDKTVPFELSQKGIANAIGLSRVSTLRHLLTLVKEGLIEEKMANVEKHKKKIKSYFLTILGEGKTREIKREIERKEVVLKIHDKEILTKVGDIKFYIKKDIPLVNISKHLKGKYFDSSVLEIEIPKIAEAFSNFETGFPVINQFFDRKNELKEMNNWLNSKSNVMFIYGVAGIGKTMLTAKFYLTLKGNKNVFWQKFFNESLRSVLTKISTFLCGLRRYKLKNYIEGRKTPDVKLEVGDAIEILEEEFREMNALIVIDNFENAPKEVFELFSGLVNKAGNFENVKIILISREQPKFYDRRLISGGIAIEREILGLDEEGSFEFLRFKNIREEDIKKIYEFTTGHPLFIEYINNIEEIKKPNEITKFLRETIFANLEKEDVEMLNSVSVYRKPVLEDGFITKNDDYSTLSKLLRKFLIKEVYLEGYLIHEVLKNIFISRLMRDEKIKYNLNAVEYYKKRDDDIEIIYHYIQAERYSEVVSILKQKTNKIIDKGQSSELSSLLDLFNSDLKLNENYDYAKNFITEEEIYEFFFYRGEVLFPIGEWDNCIVFYEKALNSKNENLLMKVYKNIGHVKREKGDFESAMNFYEKALKIAKKLNEKIAIGDIYRGIGKVYWRKGTHELAIEFLEKSLSLVENTNEKSLLADIYIDFGLVYRQRDELDIALEYYEKARNILEPLGYLYKLGRLYVNMGVLYYTKEEWDKALKTWEKNIEMTRKTKDKRQLGYSLFNSADIWAREHEEQKALNYLNESSKLLSEIGDKIGISYVYMNYGIVYSYLKEWDKSEENFNKSIEIAKELNLLFLVAERYYEFAQMYKEKEDKKKYKEILINSLNYYKKVKVEPIIEKIEEELKNIK